MCRHLPVTLSAEERKSVTRITRMLIPAYAAVALAVIAALAIVHQPSPGELVASAPVPAVSR